MLTWKNETPSNFEELHDQLELIYYSYKNHTGAYFNSVLDIGCYIKPNSCGGNPDITIVINEIKTAQFVIRGKTFRYQLASQTLDSLINEIKAYLFDIVNDYLVRE